jgi:hypothetical protein
VSMFLISNCNHVIIFKQSSNHTNGGSPSHALQHDGVVINSYRRDTMNKATDECSISVMKKVDQHNVQNKDVS